MADNEKEHLILVDEHDVAVGEEEKGKCHDGGGMLHRGFLAMVFNHSGELLLTRRSNSKGLWPGYWDGTIDGHVMKGEEYLQASRRRLHKALGIHPANEEYAFTIRYRIGYKDIGTEFEICGVTIFRGIEGDRISADGSEISEVRFTDLKALIDEVRENGEGYTPRLVMALEHISERPIVERWKPDILARVADRNKAIYPLQNQQRKHGP